MNKQYDDFDFIRFTKKSDFDKALHTLEGLINGIGIDSKLNKKEIEEIEHWIKNTDRLFEKKIYQELLETLKLALADGILTEDEKKDIVWLCKRFKTDNKFYDIITSDIQRLHGILHGIMADSTLNVSEIKGLKTWLFENEHLKGTYPYDELCSLILMVLKDGKIDKKEDKILKVFFSEFIDSKNTKNIDLKEIEKLKKEITIKGICSLDPEIHIKGKKFCFTGASVKAKRSDIKNIIEVKGGVFIDNIRKDLDFLIIGSGGNPCWAYSCYGRKVEEAVELRKQGKSIQIVHEIDFWDAF